MGTKSSPRTYRVDYRQYPAVEQVRINEVAVYYERLTGHRVFPTVYPLIAVITRIHADDTERLMKDAFDLMGVQDLLGVLRDTPRGSLPDVPARQRHRQPTGAGSATSAPDPSSPAPLPPVPPAPPPTSEPPAEPLRTRNDPEKPPPVSGWFDGTEDWPVRPPELDPDGRIKGLIYTPETRPPFDPASKQRWDRGYWEKEAAKRAAEGDLTLSARLTFWDLLPPEERVLPGPDSGVDGWPP